MRKLFFLAFALLLSAPTPAAPRAGRSAAPATPKEAPVDAIQGTWHYAADPTGKVPVEPIYEGSAITFAPDGRYSFQLGKTRIALEGTWELRGSEADTLRVHTEYGQGRRNDLTLTLRRDARGAVTGMVVREGDGSTGARFYVPRSG